MKLKWTPNMSKAGLLIFGILWATAHYFTGNDTHLILSTILMCGSILVHHQEAK